MSTINIKPQGQVYKANSNILVLSITYNESGVTYNDSRYTYNDSNSNQTSSIRPTIKRINSQ